VPTTVTAAISIEPGIMENAAVRLLGQSAQDIQNQAQDIILGQMRAVIATMRIEEINRDRQAFLGKVNEAVSGELEKIGLSLINVNIRDIEDDSGYIVALGRRAAAEAINQANVDVAEQERTGQTGVAERQRDTRVAVAAANATAEIGEAKATRDRRIESAGLDAEAVHAETDADARKASSRANQHVAEQHARNFLGWLEPLGVRVGRPALSLVQRHAAAAPGQSRLGGGGLGPGRRAAARKDRRFLAADVAACLRIAIRHWCPWLHH
jgi:flotillin